MPTHPPVFVLIRNYASGEFVAVSRTLAGAKSQMPETRTPGQWREPCADLAGLFADYDACALYLSPDSRVLYFVRAVHPIP